MHWKHSVTNEEPAILAVFAQHYEDAAIHNLEQHHRANIEGDFESKAVFGQRYRKLVDANVDQVYMAKRLAYFRQCVRIPYGNHERSEIVWQRGDDNAQVPEAIS